MASYLIFLPPAMNFRFTDEEIAEEFIIKLNEVREREAYKREIYSYICEGLETPIEMINRLIDELHESEHIRAEMVKDKYCSIEQSPQRY